jgi:hypothetical protein
MGEPKEVTSIKGALQELISVYSAMAMPSTPMQKEDQELDTLVNTEFWIHHASLHLEKVLAFLYELSQEPYVEFQNFYFTFGVGDEENSKHFIKFAASSYNEAREMMLKRFGNKWAFQYTEKEWFREGTPQDKRYGYQQIF